MTISRPAAFSSILSIHLLFYPITQHILHYNAPMVELIVKNGTVFCVSNKNRVDLLVVYFLCDIEIELKHKKLFPDDSNTLSMFL